MKLTDIKYGVAQVLNLVPEDFLSQLAVDTKADYRVRVLQGGIIFNLLLYMLLNDIRFSQRSVGNTLTDSSFHNLFPESESTRAVNHSSVSRRLNTIPIAFFEGAYKELYKRVSCLYTPLELSKYHIVAVDSSLVAQTCNHLENGFYIGPDKTKTQAARRKYVKYTAGFDGLSVLGIDFHDEPKGSNENIVLPEAIRKMAKTDRLHRNFYIIDRGLSSTKELADIDEKQLCFLVRISDKRRTEQVEDFGHKGDQRVALDGSVIEILENDTVRLFANAKNAAEPNVYRHVKVMVKKPVFNESGNRTGFEEHVVNLISDVMELEAFAMMELYRQRWMIEVFFKFIKQNLNFSHLLSTKANGLQVSMYMTMIAAMLILIYARKNRLGFRTGKDMMKHQLSNLTIAIGIIQNGGKVDDFMTQYHVTLPDYLGKPPKEICISDIKNHEIKSSKV